MRLIQPVLDHPDLELVVNWRRPSRCFVFVTLMVGPCAQFFVSYRLLLNVDIVLSQPHFLQSLVHLEELRLNHLLLVLLQSLYSPQLQVLIVNFLIYRFDFDFFDLLHADPVLHQKRFS